jgi:uncharacterized protein YcaQ
MNYLLSGGLMMIGLTATAIAALSLRVLINFVRQGPAAAEEAYERGDSVRAWWNASQSPTTLESPRDNERLAFAAREDALYGEVMVEERASFPSYVR